MKNLKSKSSNKVNHKFTYPVLLLASLPLLILGGCAGNDTRSFTGDMSLAETEIKLEMNETEVSLATDSIEQMDDLTVDMTSQEDPDYQAPADMVENIESDNSETVELVVTENLLTEPEEQIIGFAFDQSDIDEQYTELLIQHAEYLRENNNLVLQIGGHTDSSGDRAYNEFLSKKRANAVANVLLELGVPQEQIKVTGNADDKPLIGAVSHREHRRVELSYQDQQIVSN